MDFVLFANVIEFKKGFEDSFLKRHNFNLYNFNFLVCLSNIFERLIQKMKGLLYISRPFLISRFIIIPWGVGPVFPTKNNIGVTIS